MREAGEDRVMRPILFQADMVNAILSGRKTQTRRVVKPQPEFRHGCFFNPNESTGYGRSLFIDKCPYGQPGDQLWVREAWRVHESANHIPPRDLPHAHVLHYEADGVPHREFGKYRPPMFMPRWASRITLEIVSVSVERLQDISLNDVRAEGCEIRNMWLFGATANERRDISAVVYMKLWESINGAGSWEVNPYIWRIEFRRMRP